MIDIRFLISRLEDIQIEANRSDLSLGERAGLYAALQAINAKIQVIIEEDGMLDRGYAFKILGKFCEHVSAILGFDADNHSQELLNAWATGQMKSFKDSIDEWADKASQPATFQKQVR